MNAKAPLPDNRPRPHPLGYEPALPQPREQSTSTTRTGVLVFLGTTSAFGFLISILFALEGRTAGIGTGVLSLLALATSIWLARSDWTKP